MLLYLLNIDHEASELDMPNVLKVDISYSPTNKHYSFSKVTTQYACKGHRYLFVDVLLFISSVYFSQL